MTEQLTERQQQVADLKRRGHSKRAIARILGISPAAVRDHLEAIHRKLAEQEDNAA